MVPFSNDDSDLYDSSFSDDNLSKFIPAAPRTKRNERSKRFIGKKIILACMYAVVKEEVCMYVCMYV